MDRRGVSLLCRLAGAEIQGLHTTGRGCGNSACHDAGAGVAGFITNLFNPKATLFFLALFTQILSPDIAMGAKIVYGLTCIVMTMIWFSIVATVLTTPKIRAAFLRASKWIDRVCGGLFVALGIKLAVTRL